MDTLFEKACAFFDSDDWDYKCPEDQDDIALMGFVGDNAKWKCFCKTREDLQLVRFYSIAPEKAAPEKRAAVAEWVTRANYGLLVGNFEMDYSDGEIRFKTVVDVENAEFSPALVRNIVYANVMVMDRYIPGLNALLHEGMTPEEAIASIEG